MQKSIRTRIIGAGVLVTAVVAATLGAAGPASAAPALNCAGGGTSSFVSGFDIYEGTGQNVDFAGARAKSACFVFIKASGGVKVTNKYISEQWAGAEAAGLVRGVYHLAAPNTGRASAQASWFLTHGGNQKRTSDGMTLPATLDLEVNDPKSQQPGVGACYDMSPALMSQWIANWSAAVKSATGRTPIIYTSTSFWKDCVANSSRHSGNHLFITRPVTNLASGAGTLPASWKTWDFWQYNLNIKGTATFPGDQDRFNGGLTALHKLALTTR